MSKPVEDRLAALALLEPRLADLELLLLEDGPMDLALLEAMLLEIELILLEIDASDLELELALLETKLVELVLVTDELELSRQFSTRFCWVLIIFPIILNDIFTQPGATS